MGMDLGFLLLLPAMALAFFAQMRVKSAFKRYSKVQNIQNITGAEVARHLLVLSGVHDVGIREVPGTLTDHFDPRSNMVGLSKDVFHGTSIAAISVAAHEIGHAIQHDESYAPLAVRSTIFPVARFGSGIAPWLIIGGIFLSSGAGSIGMLMAYVGLILFMFYFMFSLFTLPVEFNASRRAMELLEENNFIHQSEVRGASKVLNAAALTYLAATLIALIQLLRFALIVMGGRRGD